MKKIVTFQDGKIQFTPPSKKKATPSTQQFLEEASKSDSQEPKPGEAMTPEQVLSLLRNAGKNRETPGDE